MVWVRVRVTFAVLTFAVESAVVKFAVVYGCQVRLFISRSFIRIELIGTFTL